MWFLELFGLLRLLWSLRLWGLYGFKSGYYNYSNGRYKVIGLSGLIPVKNGSYDYSN